MAFSVTFKLLHRHCIRLSLFPYTSVFTAFVFLITFIHPPFSSRSLTLRVSLIHLYRQLHSTLLSHPLTSIGTPHIDIITSIDHHLNKVSRCCYSQHISDTSGFKIIFSKVCNLSARFSMFLTLSQTDGKILHL